MSEVDRLSNSGLYPALPISDKHRNKGDSTGKPPPDPKGPKGGANAADPPQADKADPNSPRPPRSIIDEYA